MRIGTLVAGSGEIWLHPATGLSEPIQNDLRFRQAVAGCNAPHKTTRELDLRSQLCCPSQAWTGWIAESQSPAERGFFFGFAKLTRSSAAAHVRVELWSPARGALWWSSPGHLYKRARRAGGPSRARRRRVDRSSRAISNWAKKRELVPSLNAR